MYIHVDPGSFAGDGEARGPLALMQREYLALDFRRAATFLAQDWGQEWQEAVEMRMWRLRLTPERLRALLDELRPLLDRHETDRAEDGTEEVIVQLQAFPYRGGGETAR